MNKQIERVVRTYNDLWHTLACSGLLQLFQIACPCSFFSSCSRFGTFGGGGGGYFDDPCYRIAHIQINVGPFGGCHQCIRYIKTYYRYTTTSILLMGLLISFASLFMFSCVHFLQQMITYYCLPMLHCSVMAEQQVTAGVDKTHEGTQ